MKKADWFALFLSIAAFFAAYYVSAAIYQKTPHIEDEITYVWQARLAAAGRITIDSPVCPSCFLEPFIIDKDGQRFGKYPPGWPAVLSLGIRLHARNFVNPFLSALFVWFNYLLVKKLLDRAAGLIAAGLTVLSPFFLMNSGTLLAHPWSLLMAVVFTLAWLDSLNPSPPAPRWMTTSAAIGSMGMLILTRPLTAVGICLPFFIHGLFVLIRGHSRQKVTVLLIGLGAAIFSGLYLLWQYRVTGDFLQNPYELYWPYDRIGFGPEVGLNVGGHQLKYALINTKFSLRVGFSDLFGWPLISWLFMPFGLFALRKKPTALLASSVFFSLVLAYGLYWIGSWLVGPRYYYEGFFSLTLLTAAGVRFLAGQISTAVGKLHRLHQARFVITMSVLGILITGNLLFFLPLRIGGLKGLYGIRAEQMAPFESEDARRLAPALVFVQPERYWLEYGVLLDLSSPLLDTPFIFAYDRGPRYNQIVIDAYPERTVIYYHPQEPYTFYIPAD